MSGESRQDVSDESVITTQVDRIHLTRHDGGTRLRGRQVDFPESRIGTTAQQAQIVADSRSFDGPHNTQMNIEPISEYYYSHRLRASGFITIDLLSACREGASGASFIPSRYRHRREAGGLDRLNSTGAALS